MKKMIYLNAVLTLLAISVFFVGNRLHAQSYMTCGCENMTVSHPEDCSRFFWCSDGILYQGICLYGLHFNPTLGVCDYPWNVACAD